MTAGPENIAAQDVGAPSTRPYFQTIRLQAPYFIFTAVCLLAIFFSADRQFLRAFPNSYIWSEVLINYAGGPIRRGLFGEIAFLADDLIPARYSITAIVGILYFLTMAWVIRLAFNAFSFPVLLFLVSPAAILFPIYDEGSFGRKDIFILGAFVLSAAIAKSVNERAALPLIMVVYAVAGAIIETAFFYFPLVVCMLVALRASAMSRRLRLAIWFSAIVYLAVCLVLVVRFSVGTGDQIAAIGQSWQSRYPGAFADIGPLEYLDMSWREGVGMAVRHIQNNGILGYFVGFVLGTIPLLLILLDRRQAENPRLARVEWSLPFLAMALPFALAIDWGRFIHLFVMHAFIFLMATREPPAVAAVARRVPAYLYAAGGVVALLYATTWRLSHITTATSSALHAGPLLRWIGQGG